MLNRVKCWGSSRQNKRSNAILSFIFMVWLNEGFAKMFEKKHNVMYQKVLAEQKRKDRLL